MRRPIPRAPGPDANLSCVLGRSRAFARANRGPRGAVPGDRRGVVGSYCWTTRRGKDDQLNCGSLELESADAGKGHDAADPVDRELRVPEETRAVGQLEEFCQVDG
jgi:hypothetical protein